MKKYITLMLYICFHITSFAQNDEISKQITNLQLNSSPAYVVIGVDPENIQRPNSPTEFSASVQSAVVNGKMQPNFAMEFTPFYMFKKKNKQNYDLVDYIFDDYGSGLLRSLTFSAATSASDSITFAGVRPGTALGLGFHLQIVQGQPSKETLKNLMYWDSASMGKIVTEMIIASLTDEPSDFTEIFDEITSKGSFKDKENRIVIIKKYLRNILQKDNLSKTDIPKLQKIAKDLELQAQISITEINKQKFPLTKEGFMLELAAANASIAQESRWNDLASTKTAIWLTPSFRFNVNRDKVFANYIDIMAVGRITLNSRKIDPSNYVDIGGKLQWIYKRLSLSGEIISRSLTKRPENLRKKYTMRTALSLSYKINEFITFQTTFGSNFDGNSTTYSDPSKMFAVGGFNFGFGNLFGTNN